MGERREPCRGCRQWLLVPPKSTNLRCTICGTVNPVRPIPRQEVDSFRDSVRQVSDLLKGFAKSMSNTILSMSPTTNYQGTATATPPSKPLPVPSYNYYFSVPRMPLPASVYGKKRAVLCGVSYRTKSYELKGTINDVKCMRYLLVEKLKFPADSILFLTEDETDPSKIPTKQNIRAALQWLIYGCQSGDSLVFHYSGHGSQQPDMNGDERDGYDETLCPVDYETKGMILDDEINATIVRPLPRGATLHAIIDSCHSGTVLDLPYLCKINQNGYFQWKDHTPPNNENKGTSGGLALCISACDDHQKSVDTTALTGDTMTGALTYSFIKAVDSVPQLTYGHLLRSMRNLVREANRGIRLSGPIATLLNKVLFTGFSQEPQLSSSEMFDIDKKQVIL